MVLGINRVKRAPHLTWLLFVSTDGLAGITKTDAAVHMVHICIMMACYSDYSDFTVI